MKKLILLFCLLIIFNCSKESGGESITENKIEEPKIDTNSIIGKWDFDHNSNASRSITDCDIISVVFGGYLNNIGGSIKIYLPKRVLKANYDINGQTLIISAQNIELGTISNINVNGNTLSANFNLKGYCIKMVSSKKDSEHQAGMTYIKDDNFLKKIIEKLGGNAEAKGNYVNTAAIASINGQGLPFSHAGIKDLTGIEEFRNLEYMDFSNNEIEYFDFSNHPALKVAHLVGNKISSIDLSNNKNLEQLTLRGNPLDMDTLDLSQLTKLGSFEFGGNSDCFFGDFNCLFTNQYGTSVSLGELQPDAPEWKRETEIRYVQSNIRNIMYPRPNHLTSIRITDNKMESIADIYDNSNSKNIEELYIIKVEMDELDLSSFENLKRLIVNGTNIKKIKFGSINKIENLTLKSNTSLEELDVSGLTELKRFEIYVAPKLKTLDLSSNLKLSKFYFGIYPPESVPWAGIQIPISQNYNLSEFENFECILVNESQLKCVDFASATFGDCDTSLRIINTKEGHCKTYINSFTGYYTEPCNGELFKTSCN